MRGTALAVAAATVLVLSSTGAAGAASASVPRVAGETVTLPVGEALAALPVRVEDRSGYERSKFRHWIDADHDGCSTRQEVLKQEAVAAPTQGSGCVLSGGVWFSPYDDMVFDDARKLDIDHLVPLAEAWDSGASTWTPKEREAYANDLGDPRALIAVSAKSNRSKADQDPSTWLPPAVDYRCTYAADWIADKTRWGLTVDTTEQVVLADILTQCPDNIITVTTAR